MLEHLGTKRDLTLVFVRTKHGADKLVKKLSNAGVAAVAMHGNKSQRQRERALAQFESFDVDTLVATDVAARGIDVSGISHVVNFDPPHDSETYVHRIGRTGRAGATGVAISLVSSDQVKEMNRMVGVLGIDTGLGARTSVGSDGFKRADKPFRQDGPSNQDGRPKPGGQRSGYSKRRRPAQRAGKPTAGRHGSTMKPARDGKPARSGSFNRDGGPSRRGRQARDGQSGRSGQGGGRVAPGQAALQELLTL